MFNVYLICADFEGRKLYKIGYTRRSVEKRIKEIKTSNGSDIYLVDSFNSKWGTKIEANLHRVFMSKKVNGEWFDLENCDIKSFIGKCEMIHNNFESLTKDNTYYLTTGKFF